MTETIVLTEEEELELYERGRQLALDSPNYRFPLYTLGIPKELAPTLIRKWAKAGWLEPTTMIKGSGIMSNWALPIAHRAYPPGKEAVMTDEEKEEHLAQIRQCIRSNGTVKLSCLGSWEVVWQLVHAGVLIRKPRSGGHDYVLADQYKNTRG
jgi:hypothetical protein